MKLALVRMEFQVADSGNHLQTMAIQSRRYWEPSTDHVGRLSTKDREDPTPVSRDKRIWCVFSVITHRGRRIQSRRCWKPSTDHVGRLSTKDREVPMPVSRDKARFVLRFTCFVRVFVITHGGRGIQSRPHLVLLPVSRGFRKYL